MTPKYYKPKEIAVMLGISYDSAVGLIRTNMTHYRIGNRILVREEDFQKWQEEAAIVPDGNGCPRIKPWPTGKPMTDAEKLNDWHARRRAAQAARAAKEV